MHPSQTLNFINLVFCTLDRWVGFRVLTSCCDFSHFLGSIVDVKEGVTLVGCVHVLGSSEVVSHKPSLQCLCS